MHLSTVRLQRHTVEEHSNKKKRKREQSKRH